MASRRMASGRLRRRRDHELGQRQPPDRPLHVEEPHENPARRARRDPGPAHPCHRPDRLPREPYRAFVRPSSRREDSSPAPRVVRPAAHGIPTPQRASTGRRGRARSAAALPRCSFASRERCVAARRHPRDGEHPPARGRARGGRTLRKAVPEDGRGASRRSIPIGIRPEARGRTRGTPLGGLGIYRRRRSQPPSVTPIVPRSPRRGLPLGGAASRPSPSCRRGAGRCRSRGSSWPRRDIQASRPRVGGVARGRGQDGGGGRRRFGRRLWGAGAAGGRKFVTRGCNGAQRRGASAARQEVAGADPVADDHGSVAQHWRPGGPPPPPRDDREEGGLGPVTPPEIHPRTSTGGGAAIPGTCLKNGTERAVLGTRLGRPPGRRNLEHGLFASLHSGCRSPGPGARRADSAHNGSQRTASG